MSRNVIKCKICEILYVGQTKNTLAQRLKQHLYIIGRRHKSTHLYLHFQAHGVENLQIAGLESVGTWSTAQRLTAESRWIKKLGTTLPNGLNENY